MEGRGPGPTLALLPLFKLFARLWPESRCVARIPPEDELVEGYAIVLFEEAETMELSRRSRKGKGREDGEMEEEEEEDGFDPSALIIVVVCVG